MSAQTAERILSWLVMGGIIVGAISVLFFLSGCATVTTTDETGQEIRRQEFDRDAFDYALTSIITTAPMYYEIYLNMQLQRMELRRQVLELEQLEQDIKDEKFQQRYEAVLDAIVYIQQRLDDLQEVKQGADNKDLDLGMAAPPSGPPPALLSSEGV